MSYNKNQWPTSILFTTFTALTTVLAVESPERSARRYSKTRGNRVWYITLKTYFAITFVAPSIPVVALSALLIELDIAFVTSSYIFRERYRQLWYSAVVSQGTQDRKEGDPVEVFKESEGYGCCLDSMCKSNINVTLAFST